MARLHWASPLAGPWLIDGAPCTPHHVSVSIPVSNTGITEMLHWLLDPDHPGRYHLMICEHVEGYFSDPTTAMMFKVRFG